MVGRRRPAVIGTALAALTLAGCGLGGGADRPPEPGDRVAARVGGEAVWVSDVAREAVAQGVIGEGEPLGPETDAFRRLLDQVIDQKLLAREAERRKLDDDPAVQRRLLAAREQVLGDALVERTVDGAVTDEEVAKLYAEFRRGERGSETVRLRQITTTTEAEAQAVRAALQAGESFDAVALQRSTDAATRLNGGDLGYVDLALLPAATAQAVRTARTGDLIGPTAADGGFAVLRVEDRRTEPVKSLQELRPQIVRFLSFDEIRQLLERLREDADIEMAAGPGEGAPPLQEPASALRPAQNPPPPASPQGVRP